MDDIDKILLGEIKELRRELRDVRKDLASLKIRVATISTMFGIVGAYIKAKLLP